LARKHKQNIAELRAKTKDFLLACSQGGAIPLKIGPEEARKTSFRAQACFPHDKTFKFAAIAKLPPGPSIMKRERAQAAETVDCLGGSSRCRTKKSIR
jgi:hypothetical protein